MSNILVRWTEGMLNITHAEIQFSTAVRQTPWYTCGPFMTPQSAVGHQLEIAGVGREIIFEPLPCTAMKVLGIAAYWS